MSYQNKGRSFDEGDLVDILSAHRLSKIVHDADAERLKPLSPNTILAFTV